LFSGASKTLQNRRLLQVLAALSKGQREIPSSRCVQKQAAQQIPKKFLMLSAFWNVDNKFDFLKGCS
jgi:hypothetical protein